MTTYADADLPMLFPGDQVDAAAARDRLAQVRATAPLAKGLFGPMVIHHRDVTSLLRDRRLRGPGMDLARLSGIPEGSRAWARQEEILLFMEGEDHHRLRRLVSKAFTPRAVEALRIAGYAAVRRGQVHGGRVHEGIVPGIGHDLQSRASPAHVLHDPLRMKVGHEEGVLLAGVDGHRHGDRCQRRRVGALDVRLRDLGARDAERAGQ